MLHHNGFPFPRSEGQNVTPSYTSSVMNIASKLGVTKGTSGGQFAYATSKAGFIYPIRMMATTFADAKIRVNCITPGIFPSEKTAPSSSEDQISRLDIQMSNPAGTSPTPSQQKLYVVFDAALG